MKTVEAYDLRALRSALPNADAGLRKAIDRWVAAHSVRADVTIARDYVEEALTLHEAKSSPYAPVGLFHAAIVLYARALERHSNHRPAIRMGERFDRTQKAMHRKLVSIRDDGLAHFGPTGPIRPLSEDFAVLIVDGPARQPGIFSRRSLFNKAFAGLVFDHLCQSSQLLKELVEERRQGFQDIFDQALDRDFERLWPIVERCAFDRTKLGSLADSLLQQRDPGYSSTIADY